MTTGTDRQQSILIFIAGLILFLLFSSCGGGGGGDETISTSPPGNSPAVDDPSQSSDDSGNDQAGGGSLLFRNIGPGGGSFLMAIAFDPVDADTFYLGGDIEGPFKTTDGGTSFTRITTGLAQSERTSAVYATQQITLDPQNNQRLYLASWEGLLLSENAGASWSLLYPEPGPEDWEESISCVAVSPFDSTVVLAGIGDSWGNGDGMGTIIRSTDGGTTFSKVSSPALPLSPTAVVHELLFDPLTSGVVYAATNEGFFKSTDNGLNWQAANSGMPAGAVVHGLTGSVHNNRFILYTTLQTMSYSTFTGGGVYRSSDSGQSWQEITGNLPTVDDLDAPYNYYRIAVNPANANELYVGSRLGSDPNADLWWASAFGSAGVFKTTNALTEGQAQWELMWSETAFQTLGWLSPPFNQDRSVGFLGVSPLNPDLVIAGYDEALISRDGGSSWNPIDTRKSSSGSWVGSGLELMGCMSAAVDPNNPAHWWIGYDDMGLWQTTDDGASFSLLDSFNDYEPSNPVDPQENEVNGSDAVTAIAVDPEDSNTIYVGRNGGSLDSDINWAFGYVYKSSDAGNSWTQLGDESLSGGRPVLMLLPGGGVDSRTILAGIFGKGLYRSTDSGQTWTAVSAGISSEDLMRVWSMAHDPSDPGRLYLGISDATTEGGGTGGVYISSDGGVNWLKSSGASAPTGQVLDLSVTLNGTVLAATTATFSWLETGSGTGTGGLYRSTDRGNTWTLVLDQPRIEAVSASPTNADQIIAAAASYWNYLPGNSPGIYRSQDGGATFVRDSQGLSHTRFWFARYHSDGQRVLTGAAGGGLFIGTPTSQP